MKIKLLNLVIVCTIIGVSLGCTSTPASTSISTLMPTNVPPTFTSSAPVVTTLSPTLLPESVWSPMEMIWKTQGNPHTLGMPTELALDEQGNIYVIDGDNHRVQKFDKDGNFLLTWGSHGAGDGQFLFNVPHVFYGGSVTVDKDGYVYVTDHHNRIQKFDSNGTFLMKFGRTGYADGEFATLGGIAVDDQGNIYTADWIQYEIQKFDNEGKFLQKWEVPSCKPGGISFPHKVVLDGQGHIYIPNADGHCVQKFDTEGNLLQQWGTFGEAAGQFQKPRSLALDAQGNIYVSDNGNGRIQKFAPDGNFLAVYGPFDYPVGIEVDSESYVYVVEIVVGRLQKLRLE